MVNLSEIIDLNDELLKSTKNWICKKFDLEKENTDWITHVNIYDCESTLNWVKEKVIYLLTLSYINKYILHNWESCKDIIINFWSLAKKNELLTAKRISLWWEKEITIDDTTCKKFLNLTSI